MKTLSLSIELTDLAMQSIRRPASPNLLLRKIERILSKRPDILGRFAGQQQEVQRQLGKDLQLKEYRLDYELSSLYLQLVHFQPRGEWQVRGFRFGTQPTETGT